MKNQPGDRKIFNIFRLCFLMLLAASAIGAAVYTVTNPQIETWGSDVIYLDGLQAQDKDGNPIEITANQRYEYDENDILEVSGTLPDRVRDGDYICFLTWYDTEILVNGEEINRFSASAVTLPGGLLKSVYFFTPLQAEYAGQPVTIRYHRSEDSATCRIFEMTVGTRADLYRMIVEKYGTTFSLGLIILAIAGLVLLLVPLLLRHHGCVGDPLVFDGRTLCPSRRAGGNAGDRPDDPGPLPGVPDKTPRQECRGHQAPVNTSDIPVVFAALLVFTGILLLLQKHLVASPDDGHTDDQQDADGSQHQNGRDPQDRPE